MIDEVVEEGDIPVHGQYGSDVYKRQLLLSAWIAAAIFTAATGRFDILWLPLAGMATSSVLLLRDRVGRRRST